MDLNNKASADGALEEDDDDEGINQEGDEEEDVAAEEEDETFSSRDDDPLAEGETPLAPKPEPSDAKASSTKFYTICLAMEKVWEAGIKNKRWPELQKLWTVLPPKYLEWLQAPSNDSEGIVRPESIFPIFRLLMPDKDGSRQFQMAENTLGLLYGGALGLSKESHKLKMLVNFTDPNFVRSKADGLGDFSVVVQRVLERSKAKDRESGYTIGDINKELDVLSSLPARVRNAKSNHDWRPKDGNQGSPKKTKKPTLKDMRIRWLQRLNEGTHEKPGLSPLEHKWLVRILLKKLQFGVGWKKLLQWYNPYAAMLWSAHNSLKGICDKICDPEFSKARQLLERQQKMGVNGSNGNVGLDSYMPKSFVAPQFGVIFSPMLSERTGFARVLDDISKRHRDYIQSNEARSHAPNVAADCLAFRHPVFAVEPKLDGERFLVHVGRNGVVKMHTRRGNWYRYVVVNQPIPNRRGSTTRESHESVSRSELYSPVLGPPLRRAVKRGLDVILDGEIIAWDSVRAEVVPFGSNRTIAGLRKEWMRDRGLLDDRDQGMHDDDTNERSMNAANSWEKIDPAKKEVGAECWLQFVAFDLLYVDGPAASDLFADSASSTAQTKPGSIIHLDTIERRKLLYKVLDTQPNEVEIIQNWIIRPNGCTDMGENYFHPQTPTKDGKYAAYKLDSLNCTLNGGIQGLQEIDADRRHDRTDEQISEARACAIQRLYDVMVEEQRLEGLVFKDLSAPYYLGEESKSMRYWHKFKPDYFNGSVASDLDLVIIGGYYATGRKQSGKPSGVLCACVDSEDSESFFPICKVSFLSIDRATGNALLAATGYPMDDEDEDDGNGITNKWQKSDWSSKYIPEYVSQRSQQSETDGIPWRVQKKDYPDMWIHPNDSAVVVINAGEIVESSIFSAAGLTLRFPRIVRVRTGADEKHPSEIESNESLWGKYVDVQKGRSNTNVAPVFEIGSPVVKLPTGKCRFLTESQFLLSHKKRKTAVSSRRKLFSVPVLPPQPELVGSILKGITFAVLGDMGFNLESGSIDIDLATEEGWISEVQAMSKASVVTFIKKHGGRYKISADHDCTFVLGGSQLDRQVTNFVRAIENARLQTLGKRLKTKSGQLLEVMAQRKGVVRWTYVYSLVYDWLSTGHSVDEAIQTADPDRLQPTVLDFLICPSEAKRSSISLGDCFFGVDLSRTFRMRRALTFASEARKSEVQPPTVNDVPNWRDNCMKRLDDGERWIVACKHQTFWPYSKGSKSHGRTTIYPDIFHDESGFPAFGRAFDLDRMRDASSDLRSSWISSVLPLARVMGAFVVDYFSDDVSHVLCDLNTDCDNVLFDGNVKETVFYDVERGRLLLSLLQERSRPDRAFYLVSPSWIRKRKWTND